MKINLLVKSKYAIFGARPLPLTIIVIAICVLGVVYGVSTIYAILQFVPSFTDRLQEPRLFIAAPIFIIVILFLLTVLAYFALVGLLKRWRKARIAAILFMLLGFPGGFFLQVAVAFFTALILYRVRRVNEFFATRRASAIPAP